MALPPFFEEKFAPQVVRDLYVYDETTDTYEKVSPSGSGGGAVAWDDVTGKPSTFAPTLGTTAGTALAGNTALLKVGTTATDAKAGNYAPTWADVTGKPATFPPAIGNTATTALAGNTPLLTIGTTSVTAKAGNAVQTATQTTATAIAPGTATNVQAILAELAARITALEGAGG